MINTYYHVCRTCHKPAWIFTFLTGFCLLKWLDWNLFPYWGFIFFHKPGLVGFFPHGGFIFPQKPTWSSNCRGEWHRPRILRAWKQVIGSRNRTLDPQKDHAARSGNRTLDLQKRSRARPAVRTLDRLKRSFVRSCKQSQNTIMHTILKFHVRTKYAQMHKRVPRGTCPLDNRRRPDWPKNGRRTDHFKNGKASKKIMFLAEHIFF